MHNALAALQPAIIPVVAWQASSIFVILCNKHVYTSFPFPLTLVLLHMLCSTLATRALSGAGYLPLPRIEWRDYARTVAPLGAAFAASLALSNMAAARLPIASMQMLKSLAPLFTLSAMFATGKGRLSLQLVVIVACLTLGGALVNYGDLNFDSVGLALQLGAMLCEALRMVAVSALMSSVLPKANPLVGLALFAPVCGACLLGPALAIERAALPQLAASPQLAGLAALSALGALSLNCCQVWLLSQDSGPLIVSLAGVLKDMAVVLLSVAFFGNAITRVQVAGYAFALAGLNLHRIQGASGGQLSLAATLRAFAADPVTLAIACGLAAILAAAQHHKTREV
jgi:drug/metabolite transporter (DMT)-like permease